MALLASFPGPKRNEAMTLPERRGRMERRVSRADLLTSQLADSFTKLERVTWKVESLSQVLVQSQTNPHNQRG